MLISPAWALRLFAYLLLLSWLSGLLVAQTTSDEFTVVVLPDTQHYSESYPYIFNAQTQWIADQAKSQRIKFVLGVGDIVNRGESDSQYQNAAAAVSILDRAGIPYVLPVGNHDYKYSKVASRDLSVFNRYFGPSRYAGYSWYRGQYPSGSNANFYARFDVDGRKFLILALENFPRDTALNWASNVLANNRDKEVIILTHSYVYLDSTRMNRCDYAGPESMGVGGDNDGEEMWRKFVRKHPNIIMVLNGHTHGTGRRTDVNEAGTIVNQILADYQHEHRGGNGYLRILRFRPSLNQIAVSTYSPYAKAWKTDSANQFTLRYRGYANTSGTGVVQGKVRRSDCSAVAGATISVSGASAKTDTFGRYSLYAPAPKTTTVTASKSGYASKSEVERFSYGYPASLDFFLSTSSSNTGSSGSCVLSSVRPSVTICSPQAETTVASPVHVWAVAQSNHAVNLSQIYVDGAKKYEVKSATVDVKLSLPAGRRRITVQSRDSSGAIFKSTVYVQVQ